MQVSVTVELDPQNPGLAASQLRLFATKLDGYKGKGGVPGGVAVEDEAPAEPKKRGRKPAQEKAVEPDYDFGGMDADEEESGEEMFDELAEMEKQAKKGKKAKVTHDDMMAELFNFVKAKSKKDAVKILTMFGVDSPKELKEDQYAAFVAEIKKQMGK